MALARCGNENALYIGSGRRGAHCHAGEELAKRFLAASTRPGPATRRCLSRPSERPRAPSSKPPAASQRARGLRKTPRLSEKVCLHRLLLH
ncbi:unnamed protein product [Prorocentrum cordatum]|uniref:Uncharacterized protein n=1 Tax=Prorocentrum cordatum TaxID=2364126 RepID=A0ABN9UQB3_9DINO|nr:unnamed protein product [Polarella glacialis]